MTPEDITAAIKRGDLSAGEVMQAAHNGQEGTDRVHTIIELADEQLPLSDGELELDKCSAIVSEGCDNGAYVQCWAWVSFNGTSLDKELEKNAE